MTPILIICSDFYYMKIWEITILIQNILRYIYFEQILQKLGCFCIGMNNYWKNTMAKLQNSAEKNDISLMQKILSWQSLFFLTFSPSNGNSIFDNVACLFSSRSRIQSLWCGGWVAISCCTLQCHTATLQRKVIFVEHSHLSEPGLYLLMLPVSFCSFIH